MKLILCLCIMAMLVGCQQNPTGNARIQEVSSEAIHGKLTQEQAVSIATKHLDEQEWKGWYDSSKPIRVLEAPEYWNVFFRRVNFTGKPDQGLIRVYKATKEPKWVSLR